MDESTSVELRAMFEAATIDPGKLDDLQHFCESQGLREGACHELALCVLFAAQVNVAIRELPTDRERIDAMKRVLQAAVALDDALARLHLYDVVRLNGRMRKVRIPLVKVPVVPFGGEQFDAVRRACEVTVGAASADWAALPSKKLPPGRRNVRDQRAEVVAEIARRLKPYGVNPGDSDRGPFRQICDEVFFIAGIHASAQGSIVVFRNTMRPAMQDKGECL